MGELTEMKGLEIRWKHRGLSSEETKGSHPRKRSPGVATWEMPRE